MSKPPVGYVTVCGILGDGDVDFGRELMQQLARWINMAQLKHRWPDEAEGMPGVMEALDSEVHELREAVKDNHPIEHQIAELLDEWSIIGRALAGDHIRDPQKRNEWRNAVINVCPLPPGVVGQWDRKAKSERENEHGKSAS